MKIFTISLSLLCFCVCKAQSSVNSSGGIVSNSSGSLSFSVGQVFQQKAISGSFSITEGVHQPFEISSLGMDDNPLITLEMKVYPNPTASLLFLTIPETSKAASRYELYDASGRIIVSNSIKGKETQIDMQKYNAGVYILRVLDNNQALKSFRIIKK